MKETIFTSLAFLSHRDSSLTARTHYSRLALLNMFKTTGPLSMATFGTHQSLTSLINIYQSPVDRYQPLGDTRTGHCQHLSFVGAPYRLQMALSDSPIIASDTCHGSLTRDTCRMLLRAASYLLVYQSMLLATADLPYQITGLPHPLLIAFGRLARLQRGRKSRVAIFRKYLFISLGIFGYIRQ